MNTPPVVPTTPRPRAASAAPPSIATRQSPPAPAPIPTLDQLLSIPSESISSMSIGALKSILFTNHVNAGMILEKSELVKKVVELVEDERRERERMRLAEEREEEERIQRQREMMDNFEKERKQREEREKEEKERRVSDMDVESQPAASTSVGQTPPRPAPAFTERGGLCVVCQDEEANIAIVDCGHLAMCRGCCDAIMNSTRECPLCRTRIVTEQRLLRIFKA